MESHVAPIPHAIPILFKGNNATSHGHYSTSPLAGLGAGLGNAYLADALRKENGGAEQIRPGYDREDYGDSIQTTNIQVLVSSGTGQALRVFCASGRTRL